MGHAAVKYTRLPASLQDMIHPVEGNGTTHINSPKWYNRFRYDNDNSVNEDDKIAGSIISTVGSADLSATMDGIGRDKELQLEGEIQDLAGVLNNAAAYKVKMLENAQRLISDGDWGYYAKQLARRPGQFLKAWVRWNSEKAVYDYYLNADASVVFDHVTSLRGHRILNTPFNKRQKSQ